MRSSKAGGGGHAPAGWDKGREPKAPGGGFVRALVREVRVGVSGRASGRLPWNGRVAFGAGQQNRPRAGWVPLQLQGKLQGRLQGSYPVATTYFREPRAHGRRRCPYARLTGAGGPRAPKARFRARIRPLVVAICRIQ